MTQSMRIVIVVVLGLLALGTGVLVFMRADPRSITVRQALSDPGKYDGSKVAITGTASEITPPVSGFGVYRLDDATGSIYVVTKLSAPRDGVKISVVGILSTGVRTDIPVAGSITLGTYLVEERRYVVE